MNIIHINLANSLGGGEFQTLILMKRLRSLGVHQDLIARSGKPLHKKAIAEGYNVHGLSRSLLKAFGVKPERGTENLIHAHDGRGAHRAAILSTFSKTPYVITRRILKPPSSGKWTRLVYQKACRVTSVSDAVTKEMKYWQPELKVETVYDALTETTADRDSVNNLRDAANGRLIVLQAGRLSSEKGSDTTLKVARIMQSHNLPVLFWLLGDGPERSRLESSARGLNNVLFFGHKDNIGDYLGAADILIHPAESEAFGSVLLQAMQHRTAIIASRVGGIPEVLDNGSAGLLIPPGDADGFVAALTELLEKPQRRSELVLSGQRQVQQFSAAKMTDAYLSIYRNCLASQFS